MVISPKNKIRLPKFIEIDDHKVTFVTDFTLLGITIDDRLNFRKHISNIIKKVNPKLYLYKKLFYLPLSVKIQFFKFLHSALFDYYSTLIIYYPKYTIQKYIPSTIRAF